LLLGELLRLFAHQLAQFFDLFTIVRRRLGASALAVSDFAAGVLAFLSVAAAGEFLAAASPVFESSARSGPQAKSAQMSTADNILPIRSSI